MEDKMLNIVCSKIDQEKEFLNSISQEIWKNPELLFQEVQAHALLTDTLEKYGFQMHRKYHLATAFRAEFSAKSGNGPTVAILLEYDALPEIGHACGHNLIAEAGLAAAIAIKAVMEKDSSIEGKLVVLGTPAEERGAGKVKLIQSGAFKDVDVAMMVHPYCKAELNPYTLSSIDGHVDYIGKEAHAAAFPWEGVNALDAAVSCYQNISLLRQQIKPSCRINAIIAKGGTAVNVITAESRVEFLLRASTKGGLKTLISRVEACITAAAEATGCQANYKFSEEVSYENLITNQILLDAFRKNLKHLGHAEFDKTKSSNPIASTDMGNVSHVVPSIHPLYSIATDSMNHTKGFTVASGSENAQEPTLIMGKAMALTCLDVFRSQKLLKLIQEQFQLDIENDHLSK